MEASQLPTVSVIIPTFNRPEPLLRALECLTRQSYPFHRLEVIVVDDGSTDGMSHLTCSGFPFRMRCYRQENAGATMARNKGASHSLAEILTFMDDDICPTHGMLEELVRVVQEFERTIAMAAVIPAEDSATSPFGALYGSGSVFANDMMTKSAVEQAEGADVDGCFVHFSRCKTGVLTVRRQDFCTVGGFQDPTGGWPNWDDVDFGYRSHLQGFRLWQSYRAIAWHHDYSLASFEANCERAENASRSVVRLFRRYPELRPHFSAYQTKHPMSLRTDPPGLLLRKVLRSAMSSSPVLEAMKLLTAMLERHGAQSRLLIVLYRIIIGAHIQRGYRQGLRDLSRGSP
jgi:glycosyltransferase involved in cell wall biosynthesis